MKITVEEIDGHQTMVIDGESKTMIELGEDEHISDENFKDVIEKLGMKVKFTQFNLNKKSSKEVPFIKMRKTNYFNFGFKLCYKSYWIGVLMALIGAVLGNVFF